MSGTMARGEALSVDVVCSDCGGGLAHCHETLVIHADGLLECLGDDCSGAVDVHVLVLGCRELDPPCGCVSSSA